jgi:hypothetical protein
MGKWQKKNNYFLGVQSRGRVLPTGKPTARSRFNASGKPSESISISRQAKKSKPEFIWIKW